eukprot:2580165-Pleurochrysis_carterae.AAC.1
MGSRARRSASSGSRFLVEAKGAGAARAASTAPRTSPARPAPSASRPPGRGSPPCGAGACAESVPVAPANACASASFMAA